MRRLFAIIGFTYLIILTVASFLPLEILTLCLVGNAVIFLLSLCINDIRKNKVFPIALFTSLIAFSAYTFNLKTNVLPVLELCDKDINISGTICDIPQRKNGRYYYTLEVDKIDEVESSKKFKMNLSCTNALEADMYDKVKCNVHTFSSVSGKGFYSKQYAMAQKVYISAFLYDYQPVSIEEPESKPLNYYILKFRNKMISTMKSMLPESEASVANGILLGEKHDISDEIKDNFMRAGIYQFLAVSGIHMAILSKILFSCFNTLGVRKKLNTAINIGFIIFFMAINCFTPSVLRAGIMLIIYLIGNIIGRQSDSINSLGFSVLLMSLFNPNAGGDIRIWMSCLSVLGIIVFEEKIRKCLYKALSGVINDSKILNYIVKSFSLTLAVAIAIFPMTIIFFKKVSLISPLSNILMMLPGTVLIVLSLVCDLLYLIGIPKVIISPLLLILKLLSDYLIKVSEFLSKIPFSYISVEYKFISLWLSGTLILICICLIFGNLKKQLKIVSLLSINLMLAGIISYELSMKDVTRMNLVDAGNGCAIILNKNGRSTVLSCGGDEFYLRRFCDYLDNSSRDALDLVLVPSSDEESSVYFNCMESKYTIGAAVVPNELIDVNRKAEGNIIKFDNNADIKIWNNVNVKVRKADETTFINLIIDDINFLICPSGGNAESIPHRFKDCDVFIAGRLPINFNEIKSVYNILSMDKTSCEINLEKLSEKSLENYITSGYGNLNIDVKSPRTITIRRNI